MKKQILLIGGVGAGKTSLKQRLQYNSMQYQKTQVLEFSSLFVDSPGEYLEFPQYYHVLISTSLRVGEVWALQDATRQRSYYPPNFANSFRKPVVGIITKIDKENACVETAEKYLRQAGISKIIYRVSAQTGEGIDSLVQHLEVLTNDDDSKTE